MADMRRHPGGYSSLRLLADDEVGGGYETLGGGTVPEDAIGAGGAGGEAGGIENLNAVARPFSVARRLFWRGENDAALGAQFVQEQASRKVIGIGWRAFGCGWVAGGNGGKVWISGIDTNVDGDSDLEHCWV